MIVAELGEATFSMGDFITGVLIENEEGATYQGKVYDRFLKLRLLDGQLLSIFDPFGPISTGLREGEVYEMVLITLAASVSYCATSPLPPMESDEWQGIIIEPHWCVAEGQHRHACSELYAHEWILLATSSGQLLMSPKVLSMPVDPGGFLQWKNVRLDLCAVI
jgi:hypothetical protein